MNAFMRKQPRVLHIISSLGTGGAERAIFNMIENGLHYEQQAAVVSLTGLGRYGPMLKEINVPVFALNMKPAFSSFFALLELRTILRKVQPDLIQGWMYHGNLLASLSPLLLGKNVPVVWNVRHSLYELDSEKRTTKWVIKACKVLSKRTKAVIYNSNLSRKQHQAFGFSSLNGLVIPNGFELSRLLFSEESRAVIRSELGIDESTNVVGHVARFHPMKDHVGFIKAAIKVLKRDENTVFVMLGTDVTDDNSALINEISGDFRDKFRLLGEQSNVEQFMSAFDLFVLSSWSEAFPNVLGEAMACGLPCVTTDVGDAAYIVDETGLVVPPRNPDLLASAIINMLEKIERDFAVLKNKARERVEQNFSLDSTVDQYRSIYDETLPN